MNVKELTEKYQRYSNAEEGTSAFVLMVGLWIPQDKSAKEVKAILKERIIIGRRDFEEKLKEFERDVEALEEQCTTS